MKVLSTIERRQEIVNLVNEHGSVDVAKLSTMYSVSTVTIRNDLNYLDRRVMLVRSRGGAIAKNRLDKELSVKEKHSVRLKVKQKLAQAAIELIKDGESIILDSGTTTEEIARGLSCFKNIVVMTNGLNIASVLSNVDSAEVIITGGSLRKKSQSFYGRQAELSLEHFNFSKVFLGVDGISESTGITTHFEHEANLNRVMCKISKEVIAITDSSKFDCSNIHTIISLEGIDTLITDSRIPQSYVDYLSNTNVNLIIVQHPDD